MDLPHPSILQLGIPVPPPRPQRRSATPERSDARANAAAAAAAARDRSRSTSPSRLPGAVSDFMCGSLTYVLSSFAFSIVCHYFGDKADYARLCLVCRRIRDTAQYHCVYLDVDMMAPHPIPLPKVRSMVVNNVAQWHYGRENFQDGLILFIPPPGATELDPDTHPVYTEYANVVQETLSLRNTLELDYDSNGTQQKFRFSTAWLPTSRSLYNYFDCVRCLELHDFYNGIDWYLGFLDPIILSTPRSGVVSPTSSQANSIYSLSESLGTTDGGMSGLGTPTHSFSVPLFRGRQGGQPLADLAEVRFVNCRTGVEDIKSLLQTPHAAKRVVVQESFRGETFSVESSPRRRTRVSRRSKTSVIPEPSMDFLCHLYTTTLDLCRCNTQQLEELLLAGPGLLRVTVRCLFVVDQSALETASHARLRSLTLICAPDSTVRESSIEISSEGFPSLEECGLYDSPITGIGPFFPSLKLLVIEDSQLDVREVMRLPAAQVIVKNTRLCSPWVVQSAGLTETNVKGEKLTKLDQDDTISPYREVAYNPAGRRNSGGSESSSSRDLRGSSPLAPPAPHLPAPIPRPPPAAATFRLPTMPGLTAAIGTTNGFGANHGTTTILAPGGEQLEGLPALPTE